MQTQIWQTYGPQNGMVTMTNIRNTLADMLVLAGVRNTDRYFLPMTQEQEQQMMQQQSQQQGQQQALDPAAALVQAETIKAETKAQTDRMRLEIDAQKAIAEDDRQRDKMDQDLVLESAKIIGQYGTAVDVEKIKSMQDKPRYPQQQPTKAVVGGRF